MSPEEVIAILSNRLVHLAAQRELAVERGDLATVDALDEDAAATEATLALLAPAAA